MAAAGADPPIPALENHVAGDESSLVVVRVRRAGLLRELPRCHRLGLSFRPPSLRLPLCVRSAGLARGFLLCSRARCSASICAAAQTRRCLQVPLTAGDGAARVYTFGACCASYTYAGVEQLAARADTKWDGTKGLSAGIPHCFPQFGPADGRTSWAGAQHGFGRSVTWNIVGRTAASVTMRLTLDELGDASEGWAFPFVVDHTVSLSADGSELSCATTVTNTGAEKFSFTAALHSYLACSDCDAVAVQGNFKGATYIDKVDEGKEKVEEREVIALEGQFYDRVYKGVTGSLKLSDASPEKPDLELCHSIGWQDTVVS
jgi:D-hexose-6-phosphate mutarotase